MELRNKKTGDVTKIDHISIPYRHNNSPCSSWITSIAQLNEEWEDYKPTEPLIKDEKTRKAVRAWAEALGLQEVYCASNGYEIYGGIDDWVIQFEGEPFPFADNNKIYTITELCGEEEE